MVAAEVLVSTTVAVTTTDRNEVPKSESDVIAMIAAMATTDAYSS